MNENKMAEGGRGRPTINISLDDVWGLVRMGLTSSDIANRFDVSVKTIQRFKKDHGIH